MLAADPPRRGQRHRQNRRTRLQESRASRSPPGRRSRTSRSARGASSSPTATSSAEVDYLCVAGGRGPDTEGLGLEAAGVAARRGRPQDQGRRLRADHQPEGLRDRRPGQQKGARPQGRGGGRRRGRDARPASRPSRSTRTCWSARPSPTRRWPASASPRRPPKRPATR